MNHDPRKTPCPYRKRQWTASPPGISFPLFRVWAAHCAGQQMDATRGFASFSNYEARPECAADAGEGCQGLVVKGGSWAPANSAVAGLLAWISTAYN
jgi:hypothetical protein